jgi:hypothetical protein
MAADAAAAVPDAVADAANARADGHAADAAAAADADADAGGDAGAAVAAGVHVGFHADGADVAAAPMRLTICQLRSPPVTPNGRLLPRQCFRPQCNSQQLDAFLIAGTVCALTFNSSTHKAHQTPTTAMS